MIGTQRLSRAVSACRLPSILSVGFLCTPSMAAFTCAVTIQGVLQYYDGSVNVLHSGRGDWTYMCNVNEPRTRGLTVSPTACATWVAILLRAKKNNQAVQLYFEGEGSCAAIGTYANSPVPTYVGE